MTQKLCITITTIDKETSAVKLANALIDNNLAACVQIDQIQSIYAWQGKIENTQEYRLTIKTLESLYDNVEEFLKQNHTYDTPEIIKIEIAQTNKAYNKWACALFT